jgi:hypothetical protein
LPIILFAFIIDSAHYLKHYAFYIIIALFSLAILVRKAEGNRPLGRPRCSYVNNIEVNIHRMGWYGLGRIDSGFGLEIREYVCGDPSC